MYLLDIQMLQEKLNPDLNAHVNNDRACLEGTCRDYGTYIIFPTLPFLSHASFPFSHMIALMTHLHHHSFFALISTFDPYASSFFLYCYFVPISYSLLLFFYSLLLSFTLALSFLLYLLLIHTLALSFRILALLSFFIAIVLSTLLSTYVYKDQ